MEFDGDVPIWKFNCTTIECDCKDVYYSDFSKPKFPDDIMKCPDCGMCFR